jgi:hypothetical protein
MFAQGAAELWSAISSANSTGLVKGLNQLTSAVAKNACRIPQAVGAKLREYTGMGRMEDDGISLPRVRVKSL